MATFSRFIPKVKARFDYGALIFILTFNLVSVSGYRVDKLLMLAHHRVSTIMIACVEEYFKNMESSNVCKEGVKKKQGGYKCVLNSKAAQESKANFARWEPAHGPFNFGHPWKLYLKIGAQMRNFAYCIDNLNNCSSTEVQKIPELLKRIIENECLKVSSCSSKVLKELATVIRAMNKSPNIEFLVGEMNIVVQQLHNALKSLPKEFAHPTTQPSPADMNGEQTEKETPGVSLFEALPMAAMVALLTETVSRIEDIVDEVNQLANIAKFKEISELQVKV